ncbi:MAG: deoxyribodipyrimidine photolyase [Planctomycetaceae bacterium]|nr:deoxyribodipyrimidine photolyase [Planctomycetaceae bacterium]
MNRSAVSPLRIRCLNSESIRPDQKYVLYWMTAYRRLGWNFSLQRAVEHCRQLKRPLVILEALRCDYPWASDRLHSFVLQGMRDNRVAAAKYSGVALHTYVEPQHGHGKGLVNELARHACVLVTDDFPCFFLPRMVERTAEKLPMCVESVDSNGLLPMRVATQEFTTAHSFRRFLHRNLAESLTQLPESDPLNGLNPLGLSAPALPATVLQRWPAATEAMLTGTVAQLSDLPIDHSVGPGVQQGGTQAARKRLSEFLHSSLDQYGTERNHPDTDASSRLSGWLHFGHLSAHEVFHRLVARESWTPDRLGDARKCQGSREGWWGMSGAAESFLDELITWRELGFNFCHRRSDYDQYDSLPEWAQQTLEQHRQDPRPALYTQEILAAAETHDPLWNAAQRELMQTGRMHNYLRMLWGKKILQWTRTPQDALQIMIELNNRFAVDGRNPNSYSGIFWVLGRYDRAWGPERPVFGKIRYMTSESTQRKLKLTRYLHRFAQ